MLYLLLYKVHYIINTINNDEFTYIGFVKIYEFYSVEIFMETFYAVKELFTNENNFKNGLKPFL